MPASKIALAPQKLGKLIYLDKSCPIGLALKRTTDSPTPLNSTEVLNEIKWRSYFGLIDVYQSLAGTSLASYPQPNPYDALREMKRAQWMKGQVLNERVLKKVRCILDHAYRHVPYYRRLYKSLGLDPDQLSNLDDFGRFPVVTKEDMRGAGDQALADNLDRSRLFAHATSGSTGNPFKFHLDFHWRRLASKWLLDSYLGARPQTRYFRITDLNSPEPQPSSDCGTNKTLTRRLQALLKLVDPEQHPFEILYSDIAQELPEVAARLRKFNPKYGAGTPTKLMIFSEVLSRQHVEMPKLQALISGAETLLETERKRFEERFDAPVFSRYGSREFYGAVAGECEYHVGLHVNLDLVLVEIVKDNGEPCSYGETGNIVITDYYNRSMPFVRYKTGDTGSLEAGCNCGRGFPMLGNLIGRTSEWVLNKDNRKIPLLSICRHGEVLGGQVRSFQFRQTAPGRLTMYLVPEPGWNESILKERMSWIGSVNGIELDYEVVEQVRSTPSGKRTLILPASP